MKQIKLLVFAAVLLAVVNNMVLCEWPRFLHFQSVNDKPKPLTSTGLLPSTFSKSKITFFYIHGWNGGLFDRYMVELRTNLFKNLKNNLISVDWSGGGSDQLNYFASAENTKTCGKKVADFIIKNKFNLSNVYCVGHSLGAHVCGFAGKQLKGKMARITGLDPAGPNFNVFSNDRLLATDAIFVDVIHTNIALGTSIPSGYVDIFINYRTDIIQPGCNSTVDLACNHIAAIRYFGESTAKSCNLTAPQCTKTTSTAGQFTGCTELSKTKKALIGYYATKHSLAKGIYGLTTKSLCKS